MSPVYTKLGEVAEFINGAPFKPEDWGDHGLRIIRIQNLNDPSKPYNRTTRQVSERLYAQPGDLLVSWSASLGVFEWSGPDIGLVNQHIFRVLPDEQKIDKRYLRYALDVALLDMQKHLHGATMMHVNRGEFLATKVYLPALSEQRRIAAILDKADVLRAKRSETLAQLDRLAQSIFVDMFGDPVSNPKGWPLRSFNEACQTRLGKMLDQKQQTGQHSRKYLRNANVQWFRFDLNDVSEMDFDESARETFVLKDGDLLICEGGEPGRAAIWRNQLDECYYQKALHRGRPNSKLATSEYLVWLLWFLSKNGGLSDHITSATIAHLTGEKLKAMKIPLPPLGLQSEFARQLSTLEKVQQKLKHAQADQDAMFYALQKRAFSGAL